jgi:hypothetical protein
MSLQTFVQVQYESTTINHYIVIITMHLQVADVIIRENAGRIKIDCWFGLVWFGLVWFICSSIQSHM